MQETPSGLLLGRCFWREGLSPDGRDYNHTLMAGFALALGLQDERMHEVLGTILREKEAEVKKKEATAQKREE